MKEQPEYFLEVKTNHNWFLIISCIIIGLISIGIITAIAIMTYKQINPDTNIAKEGIGKTSGKTDIQKNIKENEKNEQIIKETEEKIERENNFPKHDFNSALESEMPTYNEEIERKVVGVYSSDEKQIFLTFDDGPSTSVTPKILDTLKEYDVPATFFVLGSNVDLHPDMVKRAYDEGHFIANHGYTHKYSQIYSSPQAVLDEYNQTLNSIKAAIGIQNYNPHLFRFPGGSSGGPYDSIKTEAKQLLLNNGITFTNWNCLTSDAAGSNTKEEMWQSLKETSGTKTSLVILMHDAGDKQVTAELLPELIKYYKDQGYTFKNYYDIMKN